MRTLKITILLLAFLPSLAQAQHKENSSDQTRTIEINNDNGELFISFLNGSITEFIVNDIPVSEERYSDYQEIIDDFSHDGVSPPSPPSPPSPALLLDDDNQSETLHTVLLEYLIDENIINSEKKYKIQLRRKYLKVNGQKLPQDMHQVCLDLFHEIYGHRLNDRSEVKYKKSRSNSSSSVRIVE